MRSAKPKVALRIGIAAGIVALFLVQQQRLDRLRRDNWELRRQTNLLSQANSDNRGGRNSAQVENAVLMRAATPAKRPSWREVESEDYGKYIANMRGMQIPDETIRDIVLADVSKLYDSRKTEILKGTIRDEFWKPGGRGRFVGEERLNALRELSNEKERVIKELLGLEIPQRDFAQPSNDLESEMEENWPFLAEDKLAAVTQVAREARRNAPRSDWSSDEMRSWQEQYEARLAQVLTAEDFDEFQLRQSGASFRLRDQIADFQPTEQEFRELFRLVKEFGGSMARSHSPEQWEQVLINDKKMFERESFREKASKALGEARARELLEKVRLEDRKR